MVIRIKLYSFRDEIRVERDLVEVHHADIIHVREKVILPGSTEYNAIISFHKSSLEYIIWGDLETPKDEGNMTNEQLQEFIRLKEI